MTLDEAQNDAYKEVYRTVDYDVYSVIWDNIEDFGAIVEGQVDDVVINKINGELHGNIHDKVRTEAGRGIMNGCMSIIK